MVILGEGTPSDRAYLPLATRRRRPIHNRMRMEHPPERLRTAIEMWLGHYPTATLRSATAVYNCMGLVFGSRRTVIDTDQLSKILEDDEYKKLSGPEEVEIGDIVIYYYGDSATHVGIVVDITYDSNLNRNIRVMSQWGADGEYIHPVDHAPKNYGQRKEYWTDRRRKP